jgi:hypothetical protein
VTDDSAATAALAQVILDRSNLNDMGCRAGLVVCIRDAVRGHGAGDELLRQWERIARAMPEKAHGNEA